MPFTHYAINLQQDNYWRNQDNRPGTFYFGLLVANKGKSDGIRSTAVTTSDRCVPAVKNGRMYKCTTAGTTGASEPTWPTTSGATVADGTAVWTEMTPDLMAGTAPEPGGNYSRVAVTSSLANFAGTQGAGSTTASSGTSGTISNNGAITWPASPSVDWGWVVGITDWTASTGGSLRYWSILDTPQFVSQGNQAVSFAAASVQNTRTS